MAKEVMNGHNPYGQNLFGDQHPGNRSAAGGPYGAGPASSFGPQAQNPPPGRHQRSPVPLAPVQPTPTSGSAAQQAAGAARALGGFAAKTGRKAGTQLGRGVDVAQAKLRDGSVEQARDAAVDFAGRSARAAQGAAVGAGSWAQQRVGAVRAGQSADRRPRTVTTATVLLGIAAVAVLVQTLLLAFAMRKAGRGGGGATGLVWRQFADEDIQDDVSSVVGVVDFVLLAIGALAVIGYLVVASATFRGTQWPRVVGAVLAVLSLPMLVMGPLADLAVLLGIIAVVLLWLPTSRGYADAVQRRRTEQSMPVPPVYTQRTPAPGVGNLYGSGSPQPPAQPNPFEQRPR